MPFGVQIERCNFLIIKIPECERALKISIHSRCNLRRHRLSRANLERFEFVQLVAFESSDLRRTKQVGLRHRPSQVSGTNIEGNLATVLGGSARADFTVSGGSDILLGRSGNLKDDRADHEQRQRNQPAQGPS